MKKTSWSFNARRGSSVASALVAVIALSIPASAFAQARPSVADSNHRFDIPAQPLPAALAAWSAASGIRVRTLPTAANSLQSTAVSGDQTSVAALDAMLAGTRYSFRFAELDAVVIEAIPSAADAGASLGTIRVQGTTDVATQGVNGSSDPTATEGSSSYAADQTTVGTKIPLTLKETPQSISVVTQQQLQDRNVTDFQRALMEAPGISTVYGSSGGANNGRNNLQPTFYSRGFVLSRLQIDGGAPLNIEPYNSASIVPQLNMAAYDHIEILRGADGLLDGQGDPGGVVNLERKRPLDHPQLVVSQLVGSYNTFNTTVDGSQPIAFDGKLRARVVLNRQSNGYFYDTARSKQFMFYGIIEAQITPSTIISGGINHQSQDAVPFQNGLIGGVANGQAIDLRLPRSECLCFKWNRSSYETREFFGRIEQNIVGDWKLRLNGTMARQINDYAFGGVIGVVGSADPGDAPRINDSFGVDKSNQYSGDMSIGGSFQLFGQKQTLVLGGNYSSYDGGGRQQYQPIYRFAFDSPAVDIYNFKPDDYLEPNRSGALPNLVTPINRTANLGAYGTFRFTPLKPIHFTVGMRYNDFYNRTKSNQICRNEFGCFDTTTFDFIDNGVGYNYADVTSHTAKFFPAGYLAATVDVTSTLSAYVSKTAIYIDNSLDVDLSGKPIGPTSGNNYEAGSKYASADHRLTASIAAFSIKQKGFPLFVGYGNSGADPVTGKLNGKNCCYSNDPDSVRKSKGIDVEVAGEIVPGLQISGSYIYNETKDESGFTAAGAAAVPLESQAPKHIYKIWTKYAFLPRSALRGGYVGLGLEGQSSGFSQSQPICSAFDTTYYYCTNYQQYTSRLAPRAVISAQAGYTFHDKYTLAVTVNNLLDKNYYTSVGLNDGGNWYGAPRNILVSLRGAF